MNCILEGLCDVAVVGAHLISLHSSPTYVSAHDNFHDIDYRTRYEWVTPGAYVRMANGATAGAYRNSLGKASVYVGWTWQTDDERFALTVGAVTGYRRDFTVILNRDWGHEPRVEKRGQALQPLVVPSVRFALDDRTALRLGYVPAPHKDSAAVVHLSIEKKF